MQQHILALVLVLAVTGACAAAPPRSEGAQATTPPDAAQVPHLPVDQPIVESALSVGEDAGVASGGALTPVPLGARFASLEAFRKAHPPKRDPSCGPAPARTRSASVRLGARGTITAAEVVRLAADVACAPIERCSLALRTAAGWFVAEPTDTCAGVIGPGARTARQDERLLAVKTSAAELIEYRYTTVIARTSVTPDGQRAGDERREVRWLVVCGLGASGAPSCTEPIAVSCADAEGTVHAVSWSYADGNLQLESKVDPDACQDEPLVLGTYPLIFP